MIGGAIVVASMDYVRRHVEHAGEYYGLLVLSVLGMVLLPAAGELLTAYVALELLTFSLYVMVSLERSRRDSNEASTKYIVLGALSSAVHLYGISMVWAYSSIGQAGYVLAGIAALAKPDGDGGITFSTLAANGVLLHLVGYALSTLAAFLVVIVVYNHIDSDELSGYGGLAKRSPFLAMVLAAALFSLAGLPFFAGFTTKFYLFTAVADSGLLWLAGLAVVGSLVSLYYYLRWLKVVYIDEAPGVASKSMARAHDADASSAGSTGADDAAADSRTDQPVAAPASLGHAGPGSQAAGELTPITIPRASWTLLAALLGGMILVGVWPAPVGAAIEWASRGMAG